MLKNYQAIFIPLNFCVQTAENKKFDILTFGNFVRKILQLKHFAFAHKMLRCLFLYL